MNGGSSGPFLQVSVNTDNARDLLIFLRQEIARQGLEISRLNRDLEQITQKSEIKAVNQHLLEFIEAANKRIENVSAHVHSLGQSFAVHQERVKSIIDDSNTTLSTLISEKITKMEQTVQPLVQLPALFDTLTTRVEETLASDEHSEREKAAVLADLQSKLGAIEAAQSSAREALTKRLQAAEARMGNKASRARAASRSAKGSSPSTSPDTDRASPVATGPAPVDHRLLPAPILPAATAVPPLELGASALEPPPSPEARAPPLAQRADQGTQVGIADVALSSTDNDVEAPGLTRLGLPNMAHDKREVSFGAPGRSAVPSASRPVTIIARGCEEAELVVTEQQNLHFIPHCRQGPPPAPAVHHSDAPPAEPHHPLAVTPLPLRQVQQPDPKPRTAPRDEESMHRKRRCSDEHSPRRPDETELLAKKVGMMFSRMAEQMQVLQGMITDTASKVAVCATRDDLMRLTWELTADDTSAATQPCKCLACGRHRVVVQRLPGIADSHLIDILNSPPLSKSGPGQPGASVRLLTPD
jgi:hypothetical protein